MANKSPFFFLNTIKIFGTIFSNDNIYYINFSYFFYLNEIKLEVILKVEENHFYLKSAVNNCFLTLANLLTKLADLVTILSQLITRKKYVKLKEIQYSKREKNTFC